MMEESKNLGSKVAARAAGSENKDNQQKLKALDQINKSYNNPAQNYKEQAGVFRYANTSDNEENRRSSL